MEGLKRIGSSTAAMGHLGQSAWGDFLKFLMRGNVVDLAVGIIIGNAFNGSFLLLSHQAPRSSSDEMYHSCILTILAAIVNSLVTDIIMPPIGLIVQRNLDNWFFILR